MLSDEELIHYLLDRELVTTLQIVECGLELADESRRHRNSKLTFDDGTGYFIKQGREWGGDVTLAHEASIYERFMDPSRREGRVLVRYIPRYVGFDPREQVLIVQLVPGSQDLRRYFRRRRPSIRRLPTELGRALASVHNIPLGTGDPMARFPWILSITLPDSRLLDETSAAALQFVRILQDLGDISTRLDELATGYESTAFTHGDVKWDNVLVQPQARGVDYGVKLVDWEIGGIGDPAWDVGCFLGEYLTHWVRSIPITGASIPASLADAARTPLAALRPAISAFWCSYVRHRGMNAPEASLFLERTVRYAAARLLLSAFEELHTAAEFTTAAVCLLQLGTNVLQRPDAAARTLLGLQFDEDQLLGV